MRNQTFKKTSTHTTIFSIFAAAIFIILAPTANAKIRVEGNKEFTNDVNGCLTQYGKAPGLVGEVIHELEKSSKVHKVIKSGDWNNTPNNENAALNGTGTGTVTKVSKEDLERIKERVPELANKDFCTALLHELWHAVDADRGQWSNDKEKDVYKDEIEATAFQNFIHALRGVEPRTSYGGIDISSFVNIEPQPPAAPAAPKTPPPQPTEVPTSVNMNFEHVAPGKYSEIYVTVTTKPEAAINAELSGPGVSSSPEQSKTADTNGRAKLTWRIVSFGSYTVSGTAGGSPFSSSVNVK